MDDTSLIEELVERFDEAHSAPFLFVGSGLSQRYLQTPNWVGLLKKLASLTAFPYYYYNSKANGNLARTASLIAEAFHDIWWSDKKYQRERKTYEEQCRTKSFPLKLQASNYIRGLSYLDRIPKECQGEIDLLHEARVDGIITTNYDPLMELLFPDYTVYVGQGQTLFAQSYSIAEIFKIHGSCEDPSSLVLTEEDYIDYNSRNAYLAAKLLTTFLEHPIVFLGYSLQDENVRAILASVVDCLDEEHIEKLSQRLLFVQYEHEAKEPDLVEHTMSLGKRDLRLTLVKCHDYSPVYEALASTERQLSAKLLRQIKEHLYEIVTTNDPSGRIYVVDIADLDQKKDIDFVIGVGVAKNVALPEKGLVATNIADLCRDVVSGGHDYDSSAKRVVNTLLPNLFRGKTKLIPIFKYLEKAGLLDSNGRPIRELIPDSVMAKALLERSEFYSPSYSSKRGAVRGKSIQELERKYKDKAIYYVTLVDPDLDLLERYLRDNIGILDGDDQGKADCYRRLVCIYDRRRFGPGFPVSESDAKREVAAAATQKRTRTRKRPRKT